ncbi:3-oxoacyl-ACP synthase III family protein [Brachyspira pilosicoli]|uniref:Beta-ketoacyl-[acyl-carrier-protein] synthase III n=1 Tax=Brachyspira pilosicoli TaxID=52584 RepID=A0A5C8EEZ4_BRAPL|nr:ketoacyl-ACP synthase III [Brachyspira pilosicoli]TXJ36345.1 ketoacyl-ACP synthase III [Brachyspira pilosicoli]
MKRAYIKNIAYYVPEKILDNKYFESILDTNNEWIVTRTGIETRRMARPDETIFEMGLNAVRNLEKKGVDLKDVDAILVPTVTKDYIFPSMAGQLQKTLGLNHCFALDLSAACSGYIYALNTAASLIESGQCKNILIVCSEKLTKDINWKDRGTAILFGDAATASLITTREDGKGIIGMHMQSEPDMSIVLNGGSACPIKADNVDAPEYKIYMEGSETFKRAVTEFSNSIDKVLESTGKKLTDVKYFVPHQANLRIMQAVAKRIGLPMEKVSVILNKFGNSSSTSIGLALTDALDNNKINDGDLVLLTGFGGGFTWGSTLMIW